MTALGRCTLLAAIAGLLTGLIRGQAALACTGLTIVLWILAEWLWFVWRVRWELPRLRISRSINGIRESSGILQAGRLVEVVVEVSAVRGRLHGILRLHDCIPENMAVTGNAHRMRLRSQLTSAVHRYTARIRGAGRLQLPGFRLILEDRHGFFRIERFLRCSQTLRVLPAWRETGDIRPMVKRLNAIPRHGVHRQQRTGLGSELLELREYVPGDPPKSIAWKASARRDRLMTRQYESEVPVRLQLIVDGSISTRLGGFGQRLLDQLASTAASAARAAISAGDAVGVVVFDERGEQRLPPVTGERGFYRVLQILSDFCVNPPPLPDRLTPLLQQTALAVCRERFPELLEQSVNRVPWTFFPVLPWARRRFHARCRLAGVLAELYRMPPDRHVQLLYDDAFLAAFSQHFLSQSGLAWLTPVATLRSRGFHDGAARMEMLTSIIRGATARARDNEVFLILGDLLENAHSISHLLPVLRMARARHHRIAVACPAPAFQRPGREFDPPTDLSAEGLLLAAEHTRTQELHSMLQHELRKLNIPAALTGETEAVRLVLNELELARSGRMAGGRK
ncbi:MAG: hypothetical protein RLZZ436_3876 [Planctomycetota bacterium]|jgi:uncharacterized protein (DUF58 family)